MGLFKKFKKKKTEVIDLNVMNQIINEEKEIEEEVLISNTKEEKIEEVSHQTKFQVKYYQVAQNPAYVYAEYEDRYELYYKTPQGLLRVRTDYKR